MKSVKLRSGQEGRLTERIEKTTSKVPSVGWLALAVGSMIASAGLEFYNDRKGRNIGTFVGLWAPTLLLVGIYNKLVKLEGSHRYEESSRKAA